MGRAKAVCYFGLSYGNLNYLVSTAKLLGLRSGVAGPGYPNCLYRLIYMFHDPALCRIARDQNCIALDQKVKL
jgi:hypothetical protein